ncbi:MAG TPA: MarC family protein [Hyphomicrobiales bacterium]|nr:MarC family protein [Hyphomicrobiales bacterium]
MPTELFAQALVTLFVTIDPIGMAPVFLAVTRGMTSEQRRQTAIRAVIVAGAVLVVFAVVGQRLLDFFGITMPAFRIAGGLLLFAIAFEMVFERRERRKAESVERALTHEDVGHLAVFPLAIPLIAGPGAISATILLAARAPDALVVGEIALVAAVLVASCLVVFLAAGRIERLLGDTGRIVLTRLLGVILAALAVQYVADGILAFARG